MNRVRLLVFNAALGALDYRVPPGLAIEFGSIVVAPLGPRQIVGIVWEAERLPGSEVPDAKLRPLLSVLPVPPLKAELRRLLEWTADYYCAPLSSVARMALGPNLPPYFTDDEDLAAAIARNAEAAGDPVWRLPLWKGYAEALDSDIADLKNDPDAWAQAGAVTAALILKRFAPERAWAHFDIFAWNPKAGPGRPAGGEAQAIRGLFAMIRERYA